MTASIPPKVYGQESIVASLNVYGGGTQEVIANKKLKDWAAQVEFTTNLLVEQSLYHDKRVLDLEDKCKNHETWIIGARTFLQYVAAHYPHVVDEFNKVEEAKSRVAGVSSVTVIK